ncbi:MAG: capsid protein VP2, partial [Candidatus Dadabacteria bacterium]
MHRRRRRWIQEALQRPGALRGYVRRRYGKRGFTP